MILSKSQKGNSLLIFQVKHRIMEWKGNDLEKNKEMSYC